MQSETKTDFGAVILVAEDQDLIKMLQNAFRDGGFSFNATNIPGAISLLEQDKVDLILYDYQLVKSDHWDFLDKVKRQFPEVIRVICGGFAEPPGVVKALIDGLAVSYFVKPKDANACELKIGLSRMLKIRKSLKSKKLLSLMNSIEKLPHRPLLYQDFMRASEMNATYQQLADIISKDVSVATAVLHVMNSAFYGSQGTASLEHAIMYLGVDSVRDIVLAVSLANLHPLSERQMQYFQTILRHSSLVNKYIQIIYKKINGHPIDNNCKSVGITHDIGKIILLQYFPEAYDAINQLCKETPELSFYDHELSIGQAESTHVEIGAYLLDLWNLPEVSIEVALFHHAPDKEKTLYPDVMQAVHLANQLVNYMEMGQSSEAANPDMFKYGTLLQDDFPALLTKIAKDLQREK